MTNYLIAYYLLFSPLSPKPEFDTAEIWRATLDISIKLQLTEAREKHCFYNTFENKIKFLRNRLKISYSLPKIEDLDRFPNDKQATKVYDILSDELQRADLIHSNCPGHLKKDYRLYIERLNELRHIYLNISYCYSVHYYIFEKRQCLGHVKELVGYRAYYTGEIPTLFEISVEDKTASRILKRAEGQ